MTPDLIRCRLPLLAAVAFALPAGASAQNPPRPFLPPDPDLELTGSAFFEETGKTMRSAGDVDGDGRVDLLVLRPGTPLQAGVHGRGRVDLHLGGPDGFAATPAWSVRGVSFHEAPDRDATGIGDVNGDGYDDVAIGSAVALASQPVGAVYVFLGGPNGPSGARLDDADWILRGALPLVIGIGESVLGPGDVTGDGYDDLVVGCHLFTSQDQQHVQEGAAFLFPGGPQGLPGSNGQATIADASWRVEGNTTSMQLGRRLHRIGDVDGDGLPEFAITSRGAPGTGAPSVQHWVIRGANGGPAPGLPTGAWTFGGADHGVNMGEDLAAADFDQDGHVDIALAFPGQLVDGVRDRVEVRLGRTWGLQRSTWHTPSMPISEQHGAALAAGDFDGDSRVDLAVGSRAWRDPSTQLAVARVLVYPGIAPRTTVALDARPVDWRVIAEDSGSGTKLFLDKVGDPEQDGAEALAIGFPREGIVGTFAAGRAYVFSGETEPIDPCPMAQPDWQFVGDLLDRLGEHATVGDVNGDGFDDVIVGKPSSVFQEHNLLAFHGSPQGLSPQPSWSTELGGFARDYGAIPSGAGDVDGDGYDDVLVLVRSNWYLPGATFDMGAAHLYMGGPNGLAAQPAWTATPQNAFEPTHFARAGSIVGDLNGDGLDDIAVGAFGHDNLGWGGDPHDVAGAVYVWFGNAVGLTGTVDEHSADWHAVHPDTSAAFGWRVDSPGDLDGDGDDELLVGAPFLDTGPGVGNVGALYLFEGSANGPANGAPGSPSNASWQIVGTEPGEVVGIDWRTGDVDGDGVEDLIRQRGAIDAYRLDVHLGTAGGFGPVAQSLTRPDRRIWGWGYCVVPDFDGDGRPDLAVTSPGATGRFARDGRLDVMRGTAAATITTAATWRTSGLLPQARLGSFGLLLPGDFNGDGRSDLLTGAVDWYLQSEAEQRGAFFVYHGTDSTLLAISLADGVQRPFLMGGDTVRFAHLGGLPNSPVGAFGVAWNGFPLPLGTATLGIGLTDEEGCWILDVQLPPGFPTGVWQFATLMLEDGFGPRVSNLVTREVR